MSKDKKEIIKEENYYKATEKALYNYNNTLISIDNKEEELKMLRLELKGLKNELNDYELDTVVNETGIHTSGISKVTENRITRKEKLVEVEIPRKRREIYKKRISLDKDKNKINTIDKAINNLNPRQKQIIEKFYKSKMKMGDIGAEIFLEEAQTHNVKKSAIKAIATQFYGYDFLEQEDSLLKRI